MKKLQAIKINCTKMFLYPVRVPILPKWQSFWIYDLRLSKLYESEFWTTKLLLYSVVYAFKFNTLSYLSAFTV